MGSGKPKKVKSPFLLTNLHTPTSDKSFFELIKAVGDRSGIDFSTIRSAALHAPMDCIYASIARHSCGTSGSAEQGVSKTRSLFFNPDESLGEGAGEALELGCDVGVGSTEGIVVGVGVCVEVGVAAE